MSQKELNYIEDIFNHEMLLITIIDRVCDEYDDDHYSSLMGECLDNHESNCKKALKLLEGSK